MSPAKLPADFVERIRSVTNKRARLVLDRIAQNGSVTTEELREIGYGHPPRAWMDARDLGFPIRTARVKSSAGKNIAAYSFDLTKKLEPSKVGRAALAKRQRHEIIELGGNKCQLCGATHDLQIDHRVPYEVAGESLRFGPDTYMVLCGSCNRRKSWTCEHCANFAGTRRVKICQSCYWANPETHTHVAMKEMRRAEVVWAGDEVRLFDALAAECRRKGLTVSEALKRLLASRK